MQNWLDERMKEELLRDMLYEAERRRLVKRALAARPRPARFYSPALARLGSRLVTWGCSLQARYGAIAEPPITTRANGNISPC